MLEQKMKGCSSEQDLEKMSYMQQLSSYDHINEDGMQLYGPLLTSLKGKTTWSKPPAVKIDNVQVPNKIYERNK